MRNLPLFSFITTFLLPMISWAQTSVMVHSGTGFFVSAHGEIITNNHVIEGCQHVTIRGAVAETTAEVVATDKEADLALLRTDARTTRIATIRHAGASQLRMEEPVLVMGYPQGSEQTGKYQLAPAHIVGLTGPNGEPQWLQFSDSARHGNSGGPLLDASGNVAGVIVGKSVQYQQINGGASEEITGQSDVAISLPVLRQFLDQHRVLYTTNASYGYLMPSHIEELAKSYIVNILCPQP